MIVYSNSKRQFLDDVLDDQIHTIITKKVLTRLGRNTSASEIESWRNSMKEMRHVLVDPEIPADARVAIEYNIPLTGKRIDFILTGRDENDRECAVIIELKQWSDVQATGQDAVVKTWLGKGLVNTTHPSYQAWTYASLISDYSLVVQEEDITVSACAYLHNLVDGHVINDPFYAAHVDKAPVFISAQARRLAEFLKRHVKYGDQSDLMYRIEHGRIRPSKSLADAMNSMMRGNAEFLMVDEQKLVFEHARTLARSLQESKKQVLIVKGGPGTGKSVVAINLLSILTQAGLVCQYVSKNAAPRAVFEAKLTGSMSRTRFGNLFRGSGSYVASQPDEIDVLIVDEAHRLNEKSGLYSNRGENQIKEIIHASRFSIFFIDEAQRVTFSDIGSVNEIRHWAACAQADVEEMTLTSQFRCNGSDSYLEWLDAVLNIVRPAAPPSAMGDFDFQVFDSPIELHEAIRRRNAINNKCRVVAGYCWDWKSKKNKDAFDIVLANGHYAARWNLQDHGSLWIINPDSVDQVGCIHTCQGLELDYVGVIVGPDFMVRSGAAMTDATARSSGDRSVRGYRSLLTRDPTKAREMADSVIKNTYKTLMTRGMKGCYVYFTDEETSQYFKAMLNQKIQG